MIITPTTENIRDAWLQDARLEFTGFEESKALREAEEQFDRWLAAHDKALREQVAKEIERHIIPDLHDKKDGFCPDCWAAHEAVRIARGEQA